MLEQTLRTAVIALSQANFPQVEQPDRLSDPVPELAKDGDGFLFVLACLRQVTPLQMERRQCGQRRRGFARVSQSPADDEGLRQHLRRFRMITLVGGEHAAHIERVRARHGWLM